MTNPRVDEAIKNAERLEKGQEEAGTDNPSTKVHRLVAYLQGLMSFHNSPGGPFRLRKTWWR